jgi:hypothetical protein
VDENYQQRDQIMGDEALTANDHEGCERGGRHRGGLAGVGCVGARKSFKKELVRFARIMRFCFLVVKRLGLTNELRASEDKLQGLL